MLGYRFTKTWRIFILGNITCRITLQVSNHETPGSTRSSFMTTPFYIEVELNDEWIAPVYDHVHHGRALSLLEQARGAILDRIGFPNDELMRQGKVIVVTRVDVAYRRELKRGRVQVTCEDAAVEGRTMRMRQRIINERGKSAVEGVVELMFMDHETKRGMNPPEDFLAALLSAARLA